MTRRSFRDAELEGWDRKAGYWDDSLGLVTLGAIDPLMDAIEAGPGVRVLDIGCGTGSLAAAAARRGVEIIGMDFAPTMIAEAIRRHPGIDFRVGDAEASRLRMHASMLSPAPSACYTWSGQSGWPAPLHLPRHLLFAVVAFRIQADRLGDLDYETRKVLDRSNANPSGLAMADRLKSLDRKRTDLTPGTVLVREWDRKSHRVMVLAGGFAWNGQTYNSLTKVAFAITGTRLYEGLACQDVFSRSACHIVGGSSFPPARPA
jgi:SAM-dependent methyltransferase